MRRSENIPPAAPRSYRDIAAAYVQARLVPIPVLGKSPVPSGATGAKGTVTRDKIAAWNADAKWGSANTALRHQGSIGIDVDDYGSKEGARQLAELEVMLGPLPATISSTARGQDSDSRQHFFRLPLEIDQHAAFVTKAANDIDVIQYRHRYSVVYPSIHPETQEPYLWYNEEGEPFTGGAVPSLDDFEVLPWAWVEHLMKDAASEAEKSSHQAVQYDGERPAAATPDEARKLDAIIGSLESLPAVWEPGVGWHDTVFKAACWLCRITNSNAYALTADGALTILLTHTPTYPEWGEDKILEQWASAVQTTDGQYEELPLVARPALIPPITVLDRLSTSLWDLFYKEPATKTEGALWDLRQRIMQAALKEGHDDAFAASMAFHAPHAGLELREDERLGEVTLWREFDRALTAVQASGGVGIEAAPASERPVFDVEAVSTALLSDDERKAVLYSDEFRWWGTRYLEWAQTRVGLWNAPYHRMNRWHLLSLIFSQYAYAPKRRGPMHLNLFGFVLGPSTTGKTESMELMRPVWRAAFPADDPDIGGDATPNALSEKLIQRDGKPSFFNKDEAHGLFREVAGAAWLAGLIERLTALYDCRVPMIHRRGQQDISGINAKSFFVVHMMGVEGELVDLLTEDMWKSGFLARFIWAVGDAIEIRPEDMEFDEMEGDAAEIQAAYDAMPRQWAAEFAATIRSAGWSTESPVPIRYDVAAKARHVKLMQTLGRIYQGHKFEEMLKPTLIRFGDNVRKIACLVALSEGETVVSLRHELIALEQAEEWLANVLRLVAQTTATSFARDMDKVERFVTGQIGGRARRERVYRELSPALTKWEADRIIENLVAQGRVSEETNRDGSRFVVVKQQEGAVAA